MKKYLYGLIPALLFGCFDAYCATFTVAKSLKFVAADERLYLTATGEKSGVPALDSLSKHIGENSWELRQDEERGPLRLVFHRPLKNISEILISITSPPNHAYGPRSGWFGLRHTVAKLSHNDLLLSDGAGVTPVNIFTRGVVETINEIITSGSGPEQRFHLIPYDLSLSRTIQVTQQERYFWRKGQQGDIDVAFADRFGKVDSSELPSVELSPVYSDPRESRVSAAYRLSSDVNPSPKALIDGP